MESRKQINPDTVAGDKEADVRGVVGRSFFILTMGMGRLSKDEDKSCTRPYTLYTNPDQPCDPPLKKYDYADLDHELLKDLEELFDVPKNGTFDKEAYRAKKEAYRAKKEARRAKKKAELAAQDMNVPDCGAAGAGSKDLDVFWA